MLLPFLFAIVLPFLLVFWPFLASNQYLFWPSVPPRMLRIVVIWMNVIIFEIVVSLSPIFDIYHKLTCANSQSHSVSSSIVDVMRSEFGSLFSVECDISFVVLEVLESFSLDFCSRTKNQIVDFVYYTKLEVAIL